MIICAISTIFVNNIEFHFLTYDDRISGPYNDKEKSFNHEI